MTERKHNLDCLKRLYVSGSTRKSPKVSLMRPRLRIRVRLALSPLNWNPSSGWSLKTSDDLFSFGMRKAATSHGRLRGSAYTCCKQISASGNFRSAKRGFSTSAIESYTSRMHFRPTLRQWSPASSRGWNGFFKQYSRAA